VFIKKEKDNKHFASICTEHGTVSCGAPSLTATNSNIAYCQRLLQHISVSVIQGRRRDLEPREEKVKYKLQTGEVIRNHIQKKTALLLL
jgi:hypothetical protein